MMQRIRNWLRRHEAGFTVIELTAALAITALIGLGTSVAAAQVCTQTSKNSDFTTASRQVMNAIQWVSQDVQMAQTIEGTEGFPGTADLVLSWQWWDNSTNTITYSLENGQLRRDYSSVSYNSTSLVAEYIDDDAALTNCTSVNGVLSFTITATLGEGSRAVSVTKTQEITSRPNL